MLNVETSVSIVIPVYNGNKYIGKFLENIQKQTFVNIEVIIVDDGSTDDSKEIIRKYIENSALTIKLITQKNQGQGMARNTGILHCTGEYLIFLDQDDSIDSDYVATLYKLICKNSADVVVTGYRRVNTRGRIKKQIRLKLSDWSPFMNITPWGKIYRLDHIKKNNIQFLPVVLGEDIYFSLCIYSNKANILVDSYVGYNWTINEKSVSNTTHRKLSKENSLFPVLNALMNLKNSKQWKAECIYEYFFIKTIVWHILYTSRESTREDSIKNRNELFQWLQSYFPNFESNIHIGLNEPKGELLSNRIIVWCYMKMFKYNIDTRVLRMISGRF